LKFFVTIALKGA